MSLSRLAAKCRACPDVDICDHKRMEAIGALPLPEVQVSSDVEIKMAQDMDTIIKEVSRVFRVPEQVLRGGV